MGTEESGAPPKLTICAIGDSESTHVVGRVKCFSDRGHLAYLICRRRSHIEGAQEIVPQFPPPRALKAALELVDRFSTHILKTSLTRHIDAVYLLYSHLHMFKQHKPDIVHVHYAYSTLAWLAAVVDHHPLVVSIMGGDILFDEQGHPTPRGEWLTSQLLTSADLITSKSDHLTSVLDKLGGFGDKTIKVVWGVDLARFRARDATALRTDLELSSRHRVVLSPKILQPFYNIHLVIEAMPQILAAVPETRLLITEYAADPAYRAELVEQIQRLGLQENVRFVGYIPQRDMPLYYSMADVTVAVPSSDGLPQTLLEGMACGVPNILSRLPRYEEIVAHEQSAYFVETSPQGIAEGVIRLFGDRELSETIARNAHDIVKTRADFEQEVRWVESNYYALLTMPRKRRRRRARARILLEILRYVVKR